VWFVNAHLVDVLTGLGDHVGHIRPGRVVREDAA
jgi:hypothetical protein